MLYVGENAELFHLRTKILNGYYWFAIRQNADVTFTIKKIVGLVIQVMEHTLAVRSTSQT
jgi:hypothetical protein